MNQTMICMIGKLEEDRKACWSEHLPELLLAYNATRSAVTGYSPYYLLFSRRPRVPVDYLFPTLRDSPHQTKMEVSVVAMQKRLKEAFTVARHLTSEEVARQCRYYDTSDAKQKPKYQILHRNHLLLVTDEDASSIPGQAQAKVTPIV